ncbi:hypothetical protein PISL3812_07934 [Talaromyces islandicus]|uniref:Uncharacterized protein n=1 Tax=Talaromyces islandicus TaxID=28573 RepID=A0A0U1M5I7_TALIS|nr:hypothetical protein PISL3812_07934 [Talaromyces islandicus]
MPQSEPEPPTELPDLYAGPGEPIESFKVVDYGTAFFVMIFAGLGQASTYATINAGYKADVPLVLPAGDYLVRVGIYPIQSSPNESVPPRQPLRTPFYSAKNRINFVDDPSYWDLYVAHSGGTDDLSRCLPSGTPFPRNNAGNMAKLRDTLIRFEKGWSQGWLRTAILAQLEHQDYSLPPNQTLQLATVNLDFFVYGV